MQLRIIEWHVTLGQHLSKLPPISLAVPQNSHSHLSSRFIEIPDSLCTSDLASWGRVFVDGHCALWVFEL